MQVYQALDVINQWKPNQVETLSDLLPIELINEAYSLTDTVTLLVGIALYNDKSMADIVNQLDIVDRTGKAFVAPSALTQRRKNLGEDAMKAVFQRMSSQWVNDAKLPEWHGLRLLSVDSVVCT